MCKLSEKFDTIADFNIPQKLKLLDKPTISAIVEYFLSADHFLSYNCKCTLSLFKQSMIIFSECLCTMATLSATTSCMGVINETSKRI